jgi:hypothetical protein
MLNMRNNAKSCRGSFQRGISFYRIGKEWRSFRSHEIYQVRNQNLSSGRPGKSRGRNYGGIQTIGLIL